MLNEARWEEGVFALVDRSRVAVEEHVGWPADARQDFRRCSRLEDLTTIPSHPDAPLLPDLVSVPPVGRTLFE